MDESEAIPAGARPAARVLLIRADVRLLLLQGANRHTGNTWWVAPGGGLEPGESFEAAAARELLEETGVAAPIGPCVWSRSHRHIFEGRPFHQYERFFVAHTKAATAVTPARPDHYVIGSRWWSLDELRESGDHFAPARLAELLGPILRGEYPETVLDAGV